MALDDHALKDIGLHRSEIALCGRSFARLEAYLDEVQERQGSHVRETLLTTVLHIFCRSLERTAAIFSDSAASSR